MKIELLIAPYLLTYKTLSLQDIGTFHVTQDLVLPTEQDKELMLPENAIRFDYNPRAVQDDAFIKYIMEQTRKIKPWLPPTWNPLPCSASIHEYW